MLYGVPIRSLDEVFRIRKAGFDFGEIALGNASARRMWWESGLIIAAVNTASRMSIRCLNTHLLMDTRIVSSLVLAEKTRALMELVQYDQKNSVEVLLENLSETADHLEEVFDEVPCLGLTLDVGHGNLHGPVNKSISIIQRLGNKIRHVHLHDNFGGGSQGDDLHLPMGASRVDFPAILASLRGIDYGRTMILEVKPELQEASLARIRSVVVKIQ